MKRSKTTAIDESAESEITIAPDGRIYAFGITRRVVEVLASIPASDDRIARLLRQATEPEAQTQMEKETAR